MSGCCGDERDRQSVNSHILGAAPAGFGQGLQYSIPFMTDDSYEDWSPTRPAEFYYNPQYPGGLIQNTPHFNTLWRDADDDWEDRFDDIDGDFAGAGGVGARGVGRGRRGLGGLKFRVASSRRRAGL